MVILWLKTQDRCLTDSRANIRIPDLWFCWDKRSKCVTSKFVQNDRHIEFSAPKLAPLTYCWRFWPQTALILPMLVTRVKIKTARGWLWINLILFIRCLKYIHISAQVESINPECFGLHRREIAEYFLEHYLCIGGKKKLQGFIFFLNDTLISRCVVRFLDKRHENEEDLKPRNTS